MIHCTTHWNVMVYELKGGDSKNGTKNVVDVSLIILTFNNNKLHYLHCICYQIEYYTVLYRVFPFGSVHLCIRGNEAG